MAGNVKEWCWNESRGGRMILGGGWNEPKYMYEDRDAQPPFARLQTYGFRLVKNIDPQPAASMANRSAAGARLRGREADRRRGVSRSSQRLYRYDRGRSTPASSGAKSRRLAARDVTFDAAYGNERIIVYVYLPKSAAPPYQTVVYFPGGDAPLLRSSRELKLTNVDFLIRSGRALVFPVYKGTYERGSARRAPTPLAT